VTHNPSSENLVKNALKKRNFLTHHYFWARAADFMTSRGRTQMIAELEELSNLFQQANLLATTLCKAASKAAGIPWECFEAEFDRMQKDLQDRRSTDLASAGTLRGFRVVVPSKELLLWEVLLCNGSAHYERSPGPRASPLTYSAAAILPQGEP
jgi:hypothetical protein